MTTVTDRHERIREELSMTEETSSADKVERDWLAEAMNALAEWRMDALAQEE